MLPKNQFYNLYYPGNQKNDQEKINKITYAERNPTQQNSQKAAPNSVEPCRIKIFDK